MLKGWEYQSFASIFLRSQKKDFINTESAGNCQCLEYGRQRRDLIHVFKNNDFYFSFQSPSSAEASLCRVKAGERVKRKRAWKMGRKTFLRPSGSLCGKERSEESKSSVARYRADSHFHTAKHSRNRLLQLHLYWRHSPKHAQIIEMVTASFTPENNETRKVAISINEIAKELGYNFTCR